MHGINVDTIVFHDDHPGPLVQANVTFAHSAFISHVYHNQVRQSRYFIRVFVSLRTSFDRHTNFLRVS